MQYSRWVIPHSTIRKYRECVTEDNRREMHPHETISGIIRHALSHITNVEHLPRLNDDYVAEVYFRGGIQSYFCILQQTDGQITVKDITHHIYSKRVHST